MIQIIVLPLVKTYDLTRDMYREIIGGKNDSIFPKLEKKIKYREILGDALTMREAITLSKEVLFTISYEQAPYINLQPC